MHLCNYKRYPKRFLLCNQAKTVKANFFKMIWFTTYAVVTPLRKAASYEPRIAILGIWGDTWLTRGKCSIYVVVTGPLRGLRDAFWKFCHVKSALSTVVSPT